VRERGREIGRAGKWLVADLRERLKACPGAMAPKVTPASERTEAGAMV